ncbi:MAG: glycosyltransferase [Planctomycetes bacterium]|nr:glycosyltransferase [Planctomycetota bacterium]
MAWLSDKRRGGSRHDGATLHLLNQRYKREWDRAQALQAELDHIKKSRAYRFFGWWQALRRVFRPVRSKLAAPTWKTVSLDGCLVPPQGTISIVIPFRDQAALLRNCLRSLRSSTYPIEEIVLVDNDSSCPKTLRYLDRLRSRSGILLIDAPGPFHYSRLCNAAAREARGDYVVFLNNDVEVLTPGWLERLLELGGHSAIGVVGATLLYPDHTLQHAGIFPSEDGSWSHAYRGQSADHAGVFGELVRPRAVPAVTGACMMVRRDRFLSLGGFDERFAVTMNDVDLCARVRALGLRVAITPHARLLHFESLSRGYTVS